MGAFHVGCKIEDHVDRRQAVTFANALVDTRSGLINTCRWTLGGRFPLRSARQNEPLGIYETTSRSEYTWTPAKTLEKIGVNRDKKDLACTMANGQTITRSVGFAILRADKHFTIDEVVFAELGDMTALGARTLEGLSLNAVP